MNEVEVFLITVATLSVCQKMWGSDPKKLGCFRETRGVLCFHIVSAGATLDLENIS